MERSGATTLRRNSVAIGLDAYRLQLAGLLPDVVEAAAVEERLLGNLVEVSFDQLAERGNRLVDRNEPAGITGELFCNEVRLGKEPLDLSSARHQQLVVVRQLVDTEDRDDVLQLAVPL